MKNLKYILIVLMALLFIGLSNTVKADMGPKPTTNVEVIGLTEPYAFDLLFLDDAEVLDSEEIALQIEYDYYLETYPSILNGFQDEDGFVSYTLYASAPHSITVIDTDKYHCGYFSPPETFKVVLVTKDDKLIISEVVNKSLFNAEFVFDVSNVVLTNEQDVYMNAGTITESIPVKGIILNIIVCVSITILVEGLILLAFGYRLKESFKKVIIVNLITQFILQSIILFGYLVLWNIFGAIGLLVLGEIGVFIIEIVVYIKILKEHTKGKAALYAFVANLVSMAIGILNLGLLISLFS